MKKLFTFTSLLIVLLIIMPKLNATDSCLDDCPQEPWTERTVWINPYPCPSPACWLYGQIKYRTNTCVNPSRFEFKFTGMNFSLDCLEEYNQNTNCYNYEELFKLAFFESLDYVIRTYWGGYPEWGHCSDYYRTYTESCWSLLVTPNGYEFIPCSTSICCIHDVRVCVDTNGITTWDIVPEYYKFCKNPPEEQCLFAMCDKLNTYQWREGIPDIQLNSDKEIDKIEKFSVIPIPVEDNLIISYNCEEQGKLEFKIYNYNNKLLFDFATNKTINNFSTSYSTKNLENGVYFCKLFMNGKYISTSKFIVIH